MKKSLLRKLCAISLAMVTLAGASVGGMTVYAKENVQTTVSASAKKGVYNDFEWRTKKVGKETQVVIEKYIGKRYNVAIPETIEGMKVTEIGLTAFRNNTKIHMVSIPQYVNIIGIDSFEGCDFLEKIKVSKDNKVYSSKNGLLYSASGKTLYYVPEGAIGVIVIDENVNEISSFAFHDCKQISVVDIKGKLRKLNAFTFYDCDNLREVNFLRGVDEVADDYACFQGCTMLERINILTTARESIKAKYSTVDGVLYENAEQPDDKKPTVPYKLMICPQAKKGEVTLPETVSAISYHSFKNCTKLTKVNINKNVTEIFGSAFIGSSVTELNIEKGNRFYRFNNGMLFETAGADKPLDVKAYSKKGETLIACLDSAKSRVVIPSTVKTIGNEAFCGRTLQEAVLPESIETIGACAFMDCQQLRKINIPEKVTEIRGSTFENCYKLYDLTIGKGVRIIESDAFSGCAELHFLDLAKVETIGDSVFKNCYGLMSVDLRGARSIGAFAFSGCKLLCNVRVSDVLTKINENAFMDTQIVTIYGKKGCYAEKFAKKQRIPFSTGTPQLLLNVEYTRLTDTPKRKIKIHANAVDGKGDYEYAVYYRKGTTGKRVRVKDFSKSPDAVVTLKTNSSYWIEVHVRDKAGNKLVHNYFVSAV